MQTALGQALSDLQKCIGHGSHPQEKHYFIKEKDLKT